MSTASDLDPDERREEMLRAPKSDPEDAAPRITAKQTATGATRIDIADTAAVRPGGGTTGDRES